MLMNYKEKHKLVDQTKNIITHQLLKQLHYKIIEFYEVIQKKNFY